MTITITSAGESRSFPSGASQFADWSSEADGLIVTGSGAGAAYRQCDLSGKAFVAIELGSECLAEHIGLQSDPDHERTVGFARFRLGEGDPGQLVELVRQPWTDPEAVAAAKAAFEQAGLVVAICEDFPGRIVDRLIRPYFNAALRRLDEKLASAADLDTTLRLGLGYPEGPIALLDRTGLHHHYEVSRRLYEALGDPDFAPARRAQVAAARNPE